jgi:hypothetical protein
VAETSVDYLSADKADLLAEKIASFWRNKGRANVRVWVEKAPTGMTDSKSCFCVRSNLVRGMPDSHASNTRN